MEESSVLRIADGQQDAARRAQRRPAPGGAPQGRSQMARSAAAPWAQQLAAPRVLPQGGTSLLRLPAPEAPTGAAPPIWRR